MCRVEVRIVRGACIEFGFCMLGRGACIELSFSLLG